MNAKLVPFLAMREGSNTIKARRPHYELIGDSKNALKFSA
jgi:hypothetical protein